MTRRLARCGLGLLALIAAGGGSVHTVQAQDAAAALRAGDYDAAIAVLTRHARQDPRSAPAHRRHGDDCVSQDARIAVDRFAARFAQELLHRAALLACAGMGHPAAAEPGQIGPAKRSGLRLKGRLEPAPTSFHFPNSL